MNSGHTLIAYPASDFRAASLWFLVDGPQPEASRESRNPSTASAVNSPKPMRSAPTPVAPSTWCTKAATVRAYEQTVRRLRPRSPTMYVVRKPVTHRAKPVGALAARAT